MVCGVHLRILLVFLVQAEHVRCLWDTPGQRSQRQNSNGYVGYSQQGSGLRRLGGSNPQNQLRHSSVPPGSSQSYGINAQAPAHSVYSQGPSSSRFSKIPSQPSQSGYSSVGLMQGSAKPNRQTQTVKKPKAQNFGLSSSIASGTSVSKHGKKQSAPTKTGKRPALPVQQGTWGTSKYQSSSSGSPKRPSNKSPYQSVSQTAAAGGMLSNGQGRNAAAQRSSSLLNPAAQEKPLVMQTSATAPARRVSRLRKTKTSSPSSSSALNNYFPRQTGAANPSRRHHSVAGGLAQGSYKPTSQSSRQNAAPRFQPSNPPASERSDGERYAPTRVHQIPEQFGGSPIRRLKSPEGPTKATASVSQLPNAAPSAQAVNSKPQVQSIRKPQQSLKPQVQSIRKPQQSLKPQVQSIRKPQQSLKPQVQSIRKPQQSLKPQVQSIRKPQQSLKPQVQSVVKQTYTDPSVQRVSYKPQQSLSAPSGQTVSHKPHAQSARRPATASYKPQERRDWKPNQAAQGVPYKPQQSYAAPSQVQNVHPDSKWQSVRRPYRL